MPRAARHEARALQGRDTRRRLVDAGLRLVAERGFAGATTAAIAKASGNAHGTVFVHFRTREALIDAIVQAIGEAMSRQLAAHAVPTPGLADVIDAHLGALAANEALYARLLGEANTLHDAARARVFALQSGIASRLRDAYARERDAGRARDVDSVLLANGWLALTNHYLVHRDLFAPGASVVATCGATLKAHLLSLVQP